MRSMIAGQHFYLEVREVEAAMRDLEPEPIRGAKVTGQDRRDFTAADLSRALHSLGLPCRPTPPM
jgi:hypothetical protein